MSIVELLAGPYRLRLSPKGGAIVDGTYSGVPIFRPYPEAGRDGIDPLKCGSFPLVPFGNRVEENRFSFGGATYALRPNTAWDRHYLHGDGWLSDWALTEAATAHARMVLSVETDVYAYEAEQIFALDESGLKLTLRVTNRGQREMPFGLGHHPFFPLTPSTRLSAPARRFWSEKYDYLPDLEGPIPDDLDYSEPAGLPTRWINNGFEDWTGKARIEWPERGLALDLAAPGCSRYFLFRSDTDFDPDFKGDFFCFEPMTHTANAHNLPGLSGLVGLGLGESHALQFGLAAQPLS